MHVNTVPVYIYNVHTCKFFSFIIKVYFPNLDWVGGSWNKFGKIRWALKFLSTSQNGSPNLLAKFVIYLQPTLAVTLWPVPKTKRMDQNSRETKLTNGKSSRNYNENAYNQITKAVWNVKWWKWWKHIIAWLWARFNRAETSTARSITIGQRNDQSSKIKRRPKRISRRERRRFEMKRRRRKKLTKSWWPATQWSSTLIDRKLNGLQVGSQSSTLNTVVQEWNKSAAR
jgi:hypothetical protein